MIQLLTLMIGLNPILVNPEIPTEFYIVDDNTMQTTEQITEGQFNDFTNTGICVRIIHTYWNDDIQIQPYINYNDASQANHKDVDDHSTPTLAKYFCYRDFKPFDGINQDIINER